MQDSLSSNEPLPNQLFVDFMKEPGTDRKRSGRTPEVVWGHRKFQEDFFVLKKGISFEDMAKTEYADDWGLPFAKKGGMDSQKLSLMNHLSHGQLKNIAQSDQTRWNNLKKDMKKSKNAKGKGDTTEAVMGVGCSRVEAADNVGSQDEKGIVTRQKRKAAMLTLHDGL